MGEVSEAIDRAVLETGVARIDEGMVFRDTWERYKAGGAALMSQYVPPRTPPARGYRLRLHTDAVSGPHWLTLLAVCAYLRGVIVVEKREAT